VKTESEKGQKPIGLKDSAVNLFYNIAIFALSAIVIFMIYSLAAKLLDGKERSSAGEEQTPSAIIQLEVLNGCGIPGVADRFTDFLRTNRFDVVNMGNYKSFDIDETLVVDRSGNMANARKVAKSLGIKETNVIQQVNNDYFLDVSLIIGKDYVKLNPLK
jgi:hypothetical protein